MPDKAIIQWLFLCWIRQEQILLKLRMAWTQTLCLWGRGWNHWVGWLSHNGILMHLQHLLNWGIWNFYIILVVISFICPNIQNLALKKCPCTCTDQCTACRGFSKRWQKALHTFLLQTFQVETLNMNMNMNMMTAGWLGEMELYSTFCVWC